MREPQLLRGQRGAVLRQHRREAGNVMVRRDRADFGSPSTYRLLMRLPVRRTASVGCVEARARSPHRSAIASPRRRLTVLHAAVLLAAMALLLFLGEAVLARLADGHVPMTDVGS